MIPNPCVEGSSLLGRTMIDKGLADFGQSLFSCLGVTFFKNTENLAIFKK